MRYPVLILSLWLAGTAGASDFATTVRPILEANCFKCHSHQANKFKGQLALDSEASILKGGESGPAIVSGKPEESLLVKAIRQTDPKLKMPFREDPLPDAQIEVIEAWIRDGVSAPAEVASKSPRRFTDEELSWWAIQPLKDPQVPAVDDHGWSRNEVDRFIFARLQKEGLKPSPEASRESLIRRVYFDLVGLPPTPAEVERFVQDTSPNAYEQLVDRLLDSSQYGENWARHWLDLVRYADSDGYKADFFRPNAWRYRDYVVRSLNYDKPYDQFVREQIAGDELAPNDPESLAATGYFRNGIYEYNNRDAEGQWQTILTDFTDTTSDVFMGIGLQCAHCHDHKFDPLLQKDYFRLRAFFAPIGFRDDVPLASPQEVADYQAKLAAWEEKAAPILKQIDEIQASTLASSEKYAAGQFPEEIQAIYYKDDAERSPYEKQIAYLVRDQVLYEQGKVESKIKGEKKDRLLALKKDLAALEKSKPAPLPEGRIVSDVAPTAPPTVFGKRQNETEVEPGFPTILTAAPAKIERLEQSPNSSGRRAALADWLTQPDNPLSTRVIVNRVWQFHFGRGIAANPSDLGKLGDKPSHPELLDWLTVHFVRDGWSLKQLHRLLVTSATYRQSATAPAPREALLKDPENILRWKFNTRRLEAEQIRDAVLSVTGQLDPRAGGPPSDGLTPRRSIYIKTMRNSPDPMLAVYDMAERFSSSAERNVTTTSTQALLMFNSQAILRHAQALAKRLGELAGDSQTAQIETAYRLLFGRGPSPDEARSALGFLKHQLALNKREEDANALQLKVDKMPYRDGQSLVLAPRNPAEVLRVNDMKDLPDGDFTIEGFVLLRSVYESGSVRTLAANWSGDNKDNGWSFGVTGMGSARKPQTLVLQLAGNTKAGDFHYEPIFSDLTLSLNKPYYVGVSVKLADTGKEGVTFYLKDLSNDDEPMLTAQWPHTVVSDIRSELAFTMGGRASRKDSYWDGMIDNVRLSAKALKEEDLLYPVEQVSEAAVGSWKFEAKPGAYEDSSPLDNDIAPLNPKGSGNDPKYAALADLCHVLLTSNEFIYVD